MWRNLEQRQVKKALQGDRGAGEDLFVRHYPDVHRFLTCLGLSRDEADELTQETFVNAWRSLETFQGKSSLRTWLHRIAYRQFCRRREPLLHLHEDFHDLRQDFASSLLDSIAIEKAIEQLSDPLRLPILIVHVLQLSTKDAAEILDIPHGTVLSRLHAARARLRQTLTIREVTNQSSSKPIEAPDPKLLDAL